MPNKLNKRIPPALLIYNPNAGKKRGALSRGLQTSLEDIEDYFAKYQIPVELAPTKYAGHATKLAKEGVKKGHELIVCAGGDGTAGEVAQGLVGTETTLGIIPLGSFMNIAKMLSIPNEIEKAVMLLKIGRIRRIDVGEITKLEGEKLDEPFYFLETCGFGLEAQIHKHLSDLERGDYKALFRIISTLRDYYGYKAKVVLDGKKIETRATLLNISNGPLSGANLPLAPKARLNDHYLTITQYNLSKTELARYLYRAIRGKKKGFYHKIVVDKAKKVRVETRVPRLFHADARLYGTTPIEVKIIPNALSVVTGFPESESPPSLVKRTILDP